MTPKSTTLLLQSALELHPLLKAPTCTTVAVLCSVEGLLWMAACTCALVMILCSPSRQREYLRRICSICLAFVKLMGYEHVFQGLLYMNTLQGQSDPVNVKELYRKR